MRWICRACQVEWTSTGADHGPCWVCDSKDHVESSFEVPHWAWGYRPW